MAFSVTHGSVWAPLASSGAFSSTSKCYDKLTQSNEMRMSHDLLFQTKCLFQFMAFTIQHAQCRINDVNMPPAQAKPRPWAAGSPSQSTHLNSCPRWATCHSSKPNPRNLTDPPTFPGYRQNHNGSCHVLPVCPLNSGRVHLKVHLNHQGFHFAMVWSHQLPSHHDITQVFN